MTTGKPRIYQDVEATAGLYAAAQYLTLLRYYHDLQGFPDYIGNEFFPLTSARVGGPAHAKIFAVGVIPPAAKITGKILDRSASVAAEGGIEYEGGVVPGGEDAAADGSGPTGGEITGSGGRWAQKHQWARGILVQAFRDVMGRDPTLFEIQYAQAVGWHESNYGAAWESDMGGSNNWGAVQCGRYNQNDPGCVPHQDSYADGETYPVTFKSYPTPVDGAKDLISQIFVQRSTSAGLAGPGGSMYNASLIMRRQTYYGGFCNEAVAEYGAGAVKFASLVDPDRDDATRACEREAVGIHAEEMYKTITRFIAPANGDPYGVPMGSFEDAQAFWDAHPEIPCTPSVQNCPGRDGTVEGDADSSTDWQDSGSQDAQAASQEQSKTAGTPLNQTELGRKLQAAQRMQIAEAQAAVDDMANTPPLRLLVNPRQFSVKGNKIVQDGNWGRNGPIIEHWGDEQDKISASGRVAGFFALDKTNATGPGLTRAARNYSLAWQNIMSLFLLYKSNGGVYLNDHLSKNTPTPTQNLSLMGSIYIYYDNVLYIGSFDSFNLTEEEGAPFTVDYSFEFTVRAAFLLDRPDARYDVTNSYTAGTDLGTPTTVPTTTTAEAEQGGDPPPGTSPQAAEQREQSIEDYFDGIRDSPSLGPDEDEPGGLSGIEEIQAIEAGLR